MTTSDRTNGTEETAPFEEKRVVSGIQPSGRMHLGNYMGALYNWIALQNTHECFFFIADWHALSTNYENTRNLISNTREMLIDWLSLGLDPEKSTIFLQSDVTEHAELNLLFGMMTPVSWLTRNPSFKDQQEQMDNRNLSMFGFLGYPVLMTADIALYRATHVPVGQDQLPHLELAREIVRRFHHFYGPAIPEPMPLLTPTPKLPGLDGRKMSKSYDNCLYITDSGEVIWEKIKTMVTDPQRVRRKDPGNPDVCPVYDLHRVFTTPEERLTIETGCRTAGIGCIDCKSILRNGIERVLSPAREKRSEILSNPQKLDSILEKGAEKARYEARKTIRIVRDAMLLPGKPSHLELH